LKNRKKKKNQFSKNLPSLEIHIAKKEEEEEVTLLVSWFKGAFIA